MTREDRELHAKQEYNGAVGQAIQADQVQVDDQSVTIGSVVGDVAGRDIVNVHAIRARPLTKEERRKLNGYVRKLDSDYGQSGKQTWSSIHKILGVNSIEEIHVEQYSPTEAILLQLLEIAELRTSIGVSTEGSGERANAQLARELEEQRRSYMDLEARFKKQAEAMQSLRTSASKAEGKADKTLDGALRMADTVTNLKRQLEVSENGRREIASTLKAAQSKLGSMRLNLLALSVALVVAAVSVAVIWYKADSSAKALQVMEAQSNACMFAGKPYAVGSVIDNAEAPDIECVAGVRGGQPAWKQIRASSRR
ncbi:MULTISPECIES: hypothetical protein [Burkholderia cepacia complex]|uniref:hypothetical protein n=1 Tax=Burkholderia cepacia complex TaxID=87882 RepID=UPI000BA7AE45|nr:MULTISPECIES: hypothetical protein [Burkholderia cepacia complex]PAK13980.1 hypothetical protein CJO66_13545 [Burkholderia ubonensis]RQQ00163.1 hypothetical protein DF009_01965 [Burkholderia ubonensis]RQQ49145.1 hypothetical protein DF145_16155 [Burkholderia stagnalis]RQY00044.1 hypothetical protein DF121_16310 [Burkholderia stagnalis]RQY14524.1 hypothetical protein DF115_19250 [Burkholderia stagnalis]